MKKERLFSNDVKIDQMPGHESVHTMEAEFSMNDHVEELSKRVLNRADSLSQGDGVMIANFYGDKEGLNKKIESILKYGIKGATALRLYAKGLGKTIRPGHGNGGHSIQAAAANH